MPSKLFKFPESIFSAHGLQYVKKERDQLRDNECCFVKADQHPNGDWMSYKLSLRKAGVVHTTTVDRHEFLAKIASGTVDQYMRDLVTWLCNAN